MPGSQVAREGRSKNCFAIVLQPWRLVSKKVKDEFIYERRETSLHVNTKKKHITRKVRKVEKSNTDQKKSK